DFTRISVLHSRQRKPLGNALLDSLPLVAFEALRGHLEHVSLRVGQIVQAARQPVAQVYFPSEGLISLMARGARGRRIEVGQVGNEGMIGATAILDDSVVSAIEAVVQLPTEAWQIAAKDLMPLVRNDRLLRGELLRYVQALIGQIAQTTLATGHAK